MIDWWLPQCRYHFCHFTARTKEILKLYVKNTKNIVYKEIQKYLFEIVNYSAIRKRNCLKDISSKEIQKILENSSYLIVTQWLHYIIVFVKYTSKLSSIYNIIALSMTFFIIYSINEKYMSSSDKQMQKHTE